MIEKDPARRVGYWGRQSEVGCGSFKEWSVLICVDSIWVQMHRPFTEWLVNLGEDATMVFPVGKSRHLT